MANIRACAFAIGTILAAATPATAATGPTSLGLTKAEAIIGASSALARILAEQGAPARVAPQPSSYSTPATLIRRPSSRIFEAPSRTKPDVFGTVALEVAKTPLDDRWRRVHASKVSGAAAQYAASLRNSGDDQRLDAVNRYVNGRVSFVDDSRQYRRADAWSTANETLRRGRGDCEDYAIAKLQMLRAAGFSDRDLYLVILKDLVRRSDHAVAVVRSGDRMYVLDNGTDELLDSSEVADYRPIMTFSANGAWSHGYRRAAPPVTLASAEPVLAEAAVPASAGGQRSRSASLLALRTGFNR